LRQQAQQCALALKQAAQDPRDGKGPVTAWYWGEDLGGEFFGEQDGAFGLAAGVEVILKQMIKSGSFEMPWTLLRRRFRYNAAAGVFICAIIGCERAKDD
jgi:hypothetical protein